MIRIAGAAPTGTLVAGERRVHGLGVAPPARNLGTAIRSAPSSVGSTVRTASATCSVVARFSGTEGRERQCRTAMLSVSSICSLRAFRNSR
ncbi:hypothetical protein ACFQL4_19255 [Halosimplex aquaticum]